MATREIARKVPSLDAGVSGMVRSVRSAVAVRGGAGESVLCQNCGTDGSPRAIPERPVVEDTRHFDETPGIRLCDDCEASRRSGVPSIITCDTDSYPVDEAAVYRAENHRCRGCGISHDRLALDGQGLTLHPVVPVAADGHGHERNLVPLCPYCHRRVHGEE